MVQKAKRQLTIALTIAVLSIVLFIVLGIFGTTYFANAREDKQDLAFIMEYYNDTGKIVSQPKGQPEFVPPNQNFDGNANQFKGMEGQAVNDKALREEFNPKTASRFPRRQYFYIKVVNGEVTEYKKNMPNDFYGDQGEGNISSSLDLSSKDVTDYLLGFGSKGTIKYDDSYYLFDSEVTEDGVVYFFLDTSLTHRFFDNTLRMGGLIMILTLIYVMLISRTILNKALDPLEQSIENQKRFTSDASHELRTPLTAIRSNLDILMNYDLSKEEQEEWLQNISNEIDRMATLTNDLLTLSRNDTLVKEKVDFSLSEVFDTLSFNYQNICEFEAIGGDFTVYGVREELLQLLMIFVDNGIKYNSKTDKKIVVSGTMDKNEKHFELSITDNGDGIENDKYDAIFERFYREDKARTSKSGFGLGLSIAKNIINDYDGKVKVQSEIGVGTTFKIYLVNEVHKSKN